MRKNLKRFWRRFLILIFVILSLYLILIKFQFALKLFAPRVVKTFSTPTGTAFQYNSPTIVNNYIYIGTSNWVNYPEPDKLISQFKQNFIYKLDLNLKEIWNYPLSSNELTLGGVTLDSNGNLYFVTGVYKVKDKGVDIKENKERVTITHYLYSLSNDGKFRWKKQISNTELVWIHGMINLAISKEDILYVGDKKLYSFNTNGDLIWQYPKNDKSITANLSSPIIDFEGNIYFMAPEPTSDNEETPSILVYKFEKSSNGEPLWQTLLSNEPFTSISGNEGGYSDRWNLSSPAFSVKEDIIYAVIGDTVNAVDTKTGKLLWFYVPTGITGTFKASPAVDKDNNVYISTKDNNGSTLFAIRADGKGLIWENHVGGDMYSSPLIGDDGKLYIGSETSGKGSFHAIDILTGKIKWSLSETLFEDHSFGSPALYKGYIYTGLHKQNSFGSLLKIRSDANNLDTKAAWPRFHGGIENTGRKY